MATEAPSPAIRVRVRFGLDLDGARGWPPANRLGDATLGPMGFLTLLETQLGLRHVLAREGERAVAYRAALEAVDGPERFYHASFGADALGTAATLLEWRDLWCLHGWTRAFPVEVGGRLRDLAAVEQALAGRLALSLGERLAEVAQALASRPVPVAEVIVLDPEAAMPRRWREVLARLPVTWQRAAGDAFAPGVLGDLQRSMAPIASGGVPQARVAWRDDGSLRVVRAGTRLFAAEWLRGPLSARPGSTVIVADHHGVCLDESLAQHGVPRNGFRESSTLRPATQVLTLAMELLWDPVDIGALVQFLTHPVCPLPRAAARKLAEKLVERPGVRGVAWREALEAIAARLGDDAPGVLETIRVWVECPRSPRTEGVATEVAWARADLIRQFLQDRLASDDRAERAAFAAAYEQAAEVVRSLGSMRERGEARLSARQLEQLLLQTAARGLPHPLLEAELGAAGVAHCPAAVIEPADLVVWWQMAAPAMPSRHPWSRTELAALRAAGVDLPDPGEQLAALAATWVRPVLAARQQLLLVLPPEAEESHPLWLMIRDRVDGLPVLALEDLLRAPQALAPVDAVEVTPRPLPARRRWWRLDDATRIPARPSESYSALNLMLNDPSQWVLQYPASLSRSPILSPPDRPRLYGNLAHRLVERCYRDSETVRGSPEALEAWFDANFPRVIEEEGATLLMPGELAYLADFQYRLRASVRRLQQALRAADVVAVEPECRLAGRFDGGDLSGSADLRVTRADGRVAIIDMKWSGSKRYRDRLAENRHLQLVLYGWCARNGAAHLPEVAYLILDQADMIAADRRFFPDARPVIVKDPQTLDALWNRFGVSWRWRRGQLDAGEIEIVGEDIEPGAAAELPPGAFEPDELKDDYNAYRHLRGWAP
jgi:hypothetical protein